MSENIHNNSGESEQPNELREAVEAVLARIGVVAGRYADEKRKEQEKIDERLVTSDESTVLRFLGGELGVESPEIGMEDSSDEDENKDKLQKSGVEEKKRGTSELERQYMLEDRIYDALSEQVFGYYERIKELSDEEAGAELILETKRRMLRRKRQFDRNSPETVQILSDIEEMRDEREKIGQENPRGFFVKRSLDFKDLLEQRERGGIMATEYVSGVKQKIYDSVKVGEPVFVRGHLGNGKTELALSVARESIIDRIASERAFQITSTEIKENSDFKKEEVNGFLGRTFKEERARLFGIMEGKIEPETEEEKKLLERTKPLIISGSRDVEMSDLFSRQTLEVLRPFEGKDEGEVARDFDEKFKEYLRDKGVEASDEERVSEERTIFLELYTRKNSAFGTQVKDIVGPVVRAVQEGRPVILDEANSIPPTVLIALNDLLNKRPGNTCFIPGHGAVEIPEGFSIIMTGNVSVDGVEYVGVNDFNLATLSRLKSIDVDYPPQGVDDNFEGREKPGEDELFQIMIAYLAEKGGSLYIGGGDESVEKLYHFAQLAKITQKLFCGQACDSKFYADSTGSGSQPRLECPPISVRGMMRVLKEWQNGEMSLDRALFEGYISSIEGAEDQRLVFQVAQKLGLFEESEGWNLKKMYGGDGEAVHIGSIEEIWDGRDDSSIGDKKYYSPEEVIHILYGEGPKDDDLYREVYAEFLEKIKEDDGESGDVQMTDEEYIDKRQELEGRLEEMGKAIMALKILSEECGCSVQG